MEEKILKFKNWIYKTFAFTKKGVINILCENLITANFLRYLIIGFTTFFLQLFFLFIIYQVFGVAKEYANIFSSLLCLVFNYLSSNFWTFKAGRDSHTKKLGKYLSLAFVNYTFDVVIAFPFLAVTLGVNPYLTKVFITGIIVCWNFFLYKFWVFKTPRP
jgi:putative flippase GtrA